MSSTSQGKRKLRVLLVEDSPDDAELVLCELAAAGFDVDGHRTETPEETRAALADGEWDIVLSDYNLPMFSAQEALQTLQASGKDIPFIIVSGCVGDEAAVAMMKAGAEDFVIKGSYARLAPAVNRALLEAETRRRYRSTQEELHRNEAQLRALASNIPGMVFQLQLDGDRLRFTYVSDGALALFELPPHALEESADRLLDLIIDEDRSSYLRALDLSASQLGTLDWQGRIQGGRTSAIKWIAIKAGPRASQDGCIIWDGVTTEITAAKAAEQRIRASEEEFRRLSAHVETVKEKERARIARELHDDLGGTLTAIKIDLMSLANRLSARSGTLKAKVASVDRLVDVAIQSSVRIAADLRPGALDCGIVAAVQWQARDFARRTGIRCVVHSKEDDISLPANPSVAVFSHIPGSAHERRQACTCDRRRHLPRPDRELVFAAGARQRRRHSRDRPPQAVFVRNTRHAGAQPRPRRGRGNHRRGRTWNDSQRAGAVEGARRRRRARAPVQAFVAAVRQLRPEAQRCPERHLENIQGIAP
jgi:signal transduction histidine kinase